VLLGNIPDPFRSIADDDLLLGAVPTALAGCAGHVQQLGSASLLPNLMEVKG
jgi:hypothetical protein